MSERSASEKKTWLPTGTLLEGRWKIEEKIGRGGFATVYRARHHRLERPAAVKVLEVQSVPGDHESYHERFLREAKLTARLEHPHIIEVFDFGILSRDGIDKPFLVMEMLRGHDLEEELERVGVLEPERARGLFMGALDALALSHERGIVHKDLKPSNLFVAEPGTDGERLVILDFGVARVFDDPESRLTATNQFMGTPAYLAPEYIREQITSPALDVYQMGLIIAESLTGEPVVDAAAPLGYLVAHCNGAQQIPEPLADTPLGAVLRRAVEVEPEQRPPDAAALREELAAVDWSLEALDLRGTDTPREDESDRAISLSPTLPGTPPEPGSGDPLSDQRSGPDHSSAVASMPAADMEPPYGEHPNTDAPAPDHGGSERGGPSWRGAAGGLVALGLLGTLVAVLLASNEPGAGASDHEERAAAVASTHSDSSPQETSDDSSTPEAPARRAHGEEPSTSESAQPPEPTTDVEQKKSAPEVVADTADSEPTHSAADKRAPRKRGAPARAVERAKKSTVEISEPVELLAVETIDRKLAHAHAGYRTVAGEISRNYAAYRYARERHSTDDPASIARSFSNVADDYRRAARELRSLAGAKPARPALDARARKLAATVDELADLSADSYAYRMGGKAAEHPEKLEALDGRWREKMAEFTPQHRAYLIALYDAEETLLDRRFAKTDARTSPVLHNLHGALLETVRAMRATTRDDGTRTARPHLEKMTEHADAYLKLDASSIHESISSSTTNRLDRVVRTAKMLPRKFDDLDSARKKARALQKGARAELTVANARNFLHMAYTMVMRRYLGRTL